LKPRAPQTHQTTGGKSHLMRGGQMCGVQMLVDHQPLLGQQSHRVPLLSEALLRPAADR